MNRHFDGTENAELRAKIDEAKRSLPMPALMTKLGLGEHAKESAHCPFHDDQHKSFSVFPGKDGFWHWKCFAGCGEGDEIMLLRKLRGLSLTESMTLYLDLAAFPQGVPPKSHEYPKPRECRELPRCHRSPEYPVFLCVSCVQRTNA